MNKFYSFAYREQTRRAFFLVLFIVAAFAGIKSTAASFSFAFFATAPAAVKAQPSLVGAITVQWNAVTGASQYIIERSLLADRGFEAHATVAPVSGKTTYTYRDTGLGYGESYFYRVKAVTSSGDSPWSTTVSATTYAQTKTFNIMPLGDSNTHGTRFSDMRPDEQRIAYRKQLYDLLTGARARFTYVGSERSGSAFLANDQNAGFSGSRTGDIASLLKTSSYRNQGNELVSRGSGTYLDKFNPDVVLLHLGTNGGQWGVTDDDQAIAEMAAILDEVDAYEARANKEVTVVLGLIINRVLQPNDPAAVEFTSRFNVKLAAMAENRIRTKSDRLIVVDMEKAAGLVYRMASEGGDFDDSLHPSVSGYQKMANQWFKALEPLLKPSTVGTGAPETTITQKPTEISKEKSPAFAFTSNKSPVYFEVSLNGAEYAVVSTPYTLSNLADGRYTLSVRAVDAAGRKDATPATHTWTIVTEPPTPPVFTAVTEDRGPVNNDRVTSDNTIRLSGKAQNGVEVTVSEAERGVLGKVNTNDNGDWTFNYEGTALPAGVYRFTATATDIAGNVSKVSSTFEVTIDLTRPDVALSTDAKAPVTAAFPVQLKFTEEVYGLAAGDITVTGATLGDLKEVNKSTYTATITPPANGQGTVAISLAASKATDLAGNANTASDKLEITYDLKRPKVTLSSDAPQLVKAPFSVKFTFDEPIIGFTAASISVQNGTAGNLQSESATVYTATISPTTDGEVVVSLAENKVKDEAGNGNEASAELKRLYDVAPPTVTLATTAAELTNAAIPVTVTFSEPVTGLALTSFSTTNGKLSNLQKTGNTTYTLVLTPEKDGEVSLLLAAGKVEDQAGNGNTASNMLKRQYDATAPTVVLSTDAPELTNKPFTVSFQFSEAVEGFALADITVANGAASEFKKTDDNKYSALIRPAADGEVTVRLAAGIAQDAAGNPNAASSALSIRYDATAPSGYAVAFGTDKVDHNNQNQVAFSVKGAEQGATYFYTISSDKGGTEVSGTASTTATSFTIDNLYLSGLNDGTLTLRFYQVDAAGNRGADATAQVVKLTKNIAAVSSLDAISVKFRTSFEDLPLPSQVKVRYTNGEEEDLEIKWQQGNYNGLEPGTYTLRGDLVLKPNTTNQDNRKANIAVTVEPNQPPTAVAISQNSFKPDAPPVDPLLTFSTTDPDDDTHTYTLVNGQGAQHNGYFELRDDKLYLKATNGLSGIRNFQIRVRTTDPYQNSFEQTFTLNKEVYQPANPIKLVNAFSPDGDGVNDTWTVPELRYYDEVSIQVFDRAGRRLFHTTNPEQGWDGRSQDGQVKEGSYFYIIEVKDINLVQKGVLTVLK
ncbi:Ig-like domain-containing protein [Pontibacter indicus]|uniref:Gliding motility-associated C-terminal domain-containing protein n=1 Tax=Pontibacter indicus TaxID=1317125 RepID=A0A1R3WI29_9BACT|nr:Ig-like domain-containing protein [Pontibacter indicus]SIT77750.1 gliding motility-associated C-terminal domain-containing protein [Pontibacter indicus]